MGNQNPYIEGLTTQWPKEKVQKVKQRSTKHTYKTKDRVTRTPLKPHKREQMASILIQIIDNAQGHRKTYM